MAAMRPPEVPETPPPVLREAELRKALDACAGTDFEDRRDNGMIRLFLDSGMRRGELAWLRLEDLEFDHEAPRDLALLLTAIEDPRRLRDQLRRTQRGWLRRRSGLSTRRMPPGAQPRRPSKRGIALRILASSP